MHPAKQSSDDAAASKQTDESEEKQRIVAAKAELASFVDSGVIDGEAAVLKFLHVALCPGSVPTFVDYVRPSPPTVSSSGGAGEGVSAIIMEYLPGEDMHLLRDRHCSNLEGKDKNEKPGSSTPRRVSVEDAVYLVADVMLPLLRGMHGVGMVHRDVKPSVSSMLCVIMMCLHELLSIITCTNISLDSNSPFITNRMLSEQAQPPPTAPSK